jgi:hypothetical protein
VLGTADANAPKAQAEEKPVSKAKPRAKKPEKVEETAEA